MSSTAPQAADRLGPFPAGSSKGELIALINQDQSGLRVLDAQDQARDYYKTHCEALEKIAREFFFSFECTEALILQKTQEIPSLPTFTEYIYCWFAEDKLCGVILSGVTSDAGTHGQINEQEAALEEHAAEVAEALTRKYPETPRSILNHFNFELHASLPDREGLAGGESFTRIERLASSQQADDPAAGVETVYCGPGLIQFRAKHTPSELASGTQHSHQAIRRGFANAKCLVIYDFQLERYVRTIESIHVYESLIYVSRTLAETVGRRLNTEQSTRIRDEAQAQIAAWRSAIAKSQEAKRDRILRLSEIL